MRRRKLRAKEPSTARVDGLASVEVHSFTHSLPTEAFTTSSIFIAPAFVVQHPPAWATTRLVDRGQGAYIVPGAGVAESTSRTGTFPSSPTRWKEPNANRTPKTLASDRRQKGRAFSLPRDTFRKFEPAVATRNGSASFALLKGRSDIRAIQAETGCLVFTPYVLAMKALAIACSDCGPII
jgi:hypothetical protein